MKNRLNVLLVITALTGTLTAGEYVVPKDYDNTLISNKSIFTGIVHNGSSIFSQYTYPFSNKTLKLKCFSVPKIQCRPSGIIPVISASYIEGSLRDTTSGKEVAIYANKIITENKGGDWLVCGGLYGGENWDKFDMTVTKNTTPGKEKVTDVAATYTPNANKKEIWGFTSVIPSSDRGDGRSYMVIKTRQVCP